MKDAVSSIASLMKGVAVGAFAAPISETLAELRRSWNLADGDSETDSLCFVASGGQGAMGLTTPAEHFRR